MSWGSLGACSKEGSLSVVRRGMSGVERNVCHLRQSDGTGTVDGKELAQTEGTGGQGLT